MILKRLYPLLYPLFILILTAFGCLLYPKADPAQTQVLGYGFLFLSLLCSTLCYLKQKKKKWFNLPREKLVVIIILIISTIIPLWSYLTNTTWVTITKLDLRNPSAAAPEQVPEHPDLNVVIRSIYVDGHSIDLKQFSNSEWAYGGEVLSAKNNGATLDLKLPRYHSLNIVFDHAWDKGIVELSLPGESMQIDCYQPYYSPQSTNIPYSAKAAVSIPFFISVLLLESLFLLLLSNCFKVQPQSPKAAQHLLCAVTSIIFLLQIVNFHCNTSQMLSIVSFVLGVILSGVLWSLCYRNAGGFTAKDKALLLACLTLSAGLIVLMYPSLVIRNIEDTTITIQVKSEKSVEADGVAAAIGYIQRSGTQLSLNELTTSGWSAEENLFLYSDTPGARITFSAKSEEEIKLNLIGRPDGGIISISGTGENAEINLYNIGERNIYRAFHAQPGSVNIVSTLFLFISVGIALSGLLYGLAIPFSVYMISLGLHIEDDKIGRADKILYYVLSLVVPIQFYFYLIHRNQTELNFQQTSILGLFFSLSGVIVFLFLKWLYGNERAAFVFSIPLWMSFFTCRTVYLVVSRFVGVRYRIFLGVTLVFLYILGLLVFVLTKKFKSPQPYRIIALFLSCLLFFNLIPNLYWGIFQQKSVKEIEFKDDFIVDESLPSPNIYWILMDGMLGFDSYEYFFGDPQTEFTDALEQLDFVINRNGQFEIGHRTKFSLPLLTNPSAYDELFYPLLFPSDDPSKNKTGNDAAYLLEQYDDTLSLLMQKRELDTALLKKGYNTAYMGDVLPLGSVEYYYYLKGDYAVYHQTDLSPEGIDSIEKLNNWLTIKELLDATSITSIIKNNFIYNQINKKITVYPYPEFDSEVQNLVGSEIFYSLPYAYSAIKESLRSPTPQFMMLHQFISHYPFEYLEDGNKNPGPFDEHDPTLYPAQHRYSTSVVLKMIELIVAYDPDAVIIIQSDHGMHSPGLRDKFIDLGFEGTDVIYAFNGTISAVRIPEAYGGLDHPIYPLDISRELVNRFVGQNYELIDQNRVKVEVPEAKS